MESKLTLFIAIVSFAVLLQAAVLAAIYFALRKLQANVDELQRKAMPVIDQTRELLTDVAPQLRTVSANLMEISVTARAQTQEIADTISSLNAKVRTNLDRAEEFVNETIEKVERTTDFVEKKVMSPVRKANAMAAAFSAALDNLRGIDRRNAPKNYNSDGEEFI